MKANELRFNNIIKGKWNLIGRVKFITEHDVVLFDDNSGEEWQPELKDCFGIPLTEEWFLKFGFTKSNDSWAGWLINVGEHGNQLRIMDELYWDSGYLKAPCKCVHQLQNIFFALTGEELTLTPL